METAKDLQTTRLFERKTETNKNKRVKIGRQKEDSVKRRRKSRAKDSDLEKLS